MLIISTVGLAIVGLVAGGGLLFELHANRDLRASNRALETELRVAQKTLEALRKENQEIAEQLAKTQDASAVLQKRIAEIEADGAKDSEAPMAPPVVAPYQVPAYLGQTYLGPAWVVPRNFRMDTNAQRYVYEPVVWLDENLRNNFVVHHTNVVEREVETTYVQNSYYPQPLYFLSSSHRHHRGPVQLPSVPRSPSPPQAPQVPSAPQLPVSGMQPTARFNPGSGATTPQRLGISAGSIKTRPQVLGIPTPPSQ